MNRPPIIDLEATGKNIARLRDQAGLSVQDLQKKLCFVSEQAIYKWECGKNLPTVDNLIALADIFGVTIDDIIIRF